MFMSIKVNYGLLVMGSSARRIRSATKLKRRPLFLKQTNDPLHLH